MTARPPGARAPLEPQHGPAPSRPRLVLTDLGDRSFRFALRSQVNAPLLTGGPLTGSGDLQADGQALLTLLRRDGSLRRASTSQGEIVELVQSDGGIVGRSRPTPDARLADAHLKLIRVQVDHAVVTIGAA